ncbi:hypothetical protein [Burkholderia ambifaria]|uniref:hypothetical protein n=1 Tax=Burkholderia ambifaria TaxID=152480 RepID=UPI001588CCAD|nr:hypothetical protein [Burkholderia ambifaria]
MRTGGTLAWLIYSTHQIIADKIAPERPKHLRREMFNPIRQKTGLPIAPDPPELNFPRPPPQNPAKSAVSRRRPMPERQPTHFNDTDQHLTH